MTIESTLAQLGPFQHLIGEWGNVAFPNSEQGSITKPLSYVVMPLPETDSPNGFILKNFSYYEKLQVNDSNAVASPVNAPNRGGVYTQNSSAVFYDQQVHFAEGPAINEIVHVENGAWLHLKTSPQYNGPYNMGSVISKTVPPQSAIMTIAKQVSVPHGNSILALGSFESGSVIPTIPDAATPFPRPTGLSQDSYINKLDSTENYQNPQPDYTANPNLPIQQAVNIINPVSFITWKVSTSELAGGKGSVTNIPFEQHKANVSDYSTNYWLLTTNGQNYDFLVYTQTITMQIMIKGTLYDFPHTTCNALSRIKAP